MLQFLVDFTENKGDVDPLLKSALWSANNFLSVLQEHRKQSTLLTQEIIQQVLTVGAFFQKCYLRLAEVQRFLHIFALQCATKVSFANTLDMCV